MSGVQLSTYDNSDYKPGSLLRRSVWYVISLLIFHSHIFPSSGLKVRLLRIFGGTIGSGVVIKPGVKIKYPWFLAVGDNTWIGEGAWIDNLVSVTIGSNVCISQGALLLTGNHNYKSRRFDLITGTITLHNGVWIGARSTVTPGTEAGEHAVLAVGSVAGGYLEPFTIYRGNPATAVRKRSIA